MDRYCRESITRSAPGRVRAFRMSGPRWGIVLSVTALAACGAGEQGDSGARAATADVTQDAESVAEASQEAAADAVARILVGGIEVQVEIADEPDERERGLMFRESLSDEEGMLFVYGTEQTLSFWMKNTPLALDIAFIDATGSIVDIQQMEPFTEQTHLSKRPAMYALEMRKGWFADHGVAVGAQVEF